MLRLKNGKIAINPAHIASVHIFEEQVFIDMSDESTRHSVSLETEEKAIWFAEYVESLVEITNSGQMDLSIEDFRVFELYFQEKGILMPKKRGAVELRQSEDI